MELQTLSLKDLKELQTQVARAIATFEDRRKKDALAELEEKAREMGFSLSELTGVQPAKKQRAPATPKFVNPANKAETWSGRGRKPRWYEAGLKSGKKPEDMTI